MRGRPRLWIDNLSSRFPLKKSWTLAVDTGGTFTDCLGVSPDGQLKRAKVLSTGALRLRVKGREGKRTLSLDFHWEAPNEFFRGFRIRRAGSIDEGHEVVECDLINNRVSVSTDIGEEFEAGTLVEFFGANRSPLFKFQRTSGRSGRWFTQGFCRQGDSAKGP